MKLWQRGDARWDTYTKGCWHYAGEGFCVQCDPASYGPCPSDCKTQHEHCTCDPRTGATCAVHDDEESCVA